MILRRASTSGLVALVAVALQALTASPIDPPDGTPSPVPTVTTTDTGFQVAATSLAIDGLRIEGNGTAPTSTTTGPTLNLAAEQAVGEDLEIAAGITDRTLAVNCPTRCRLTGRPVRLHVIELTATPVVAGLALVPITLNASTPAPTLLELARLPHLTLRDVRGRLALITADEVETGETSIRLLD